jgi:hypothetical protein
MVNSFDKDTINNIRLYTFSLSSRAFDATLSCRFIFFPQHFFNIFKSALVCVADVISQE